jgi:2-oxoisovalerate dehydrogenase E1 component alpha subunit
MLMIVANNRWGISTAFAGQHGYDQIADRGRAFGIETAIVDGNDPEVMYAALSKAMDYVRTKRRPYLLEAMVSRLRGHSSASGANLVKDEPDCVALFEDKLVDRKLLSRTQIDDRRDAYTKELLEASQRVVEEDQPTPESAFDYIFADKNYVAGER